MFPKFHGTSEGWRKLWIMKVRGSAPDSCWKLFEESSFLLLCPYWRERWFFLFFLTTTHKTMKNLWTRWYCRQLMSQSVISFFPLISVALIGPHTWYAASCLVTVEKKKRNIFSCVGVHKIRTRNCFIIYPSCQIHSVLLFKCSQSYSLCYYVTTVVECPLSHPKEKYSPVRFYVN